MYDWLRIQRVNSYKTQKHYILDDSGSKYVFYMLLTRLISNKMFSNTTCLPHFSLNDTCSKVTFMFMISNTIDVKEVNSIVDAVVRFNIWSAKQYKNII